MKKLLSCGRKVRRRKEDRTSAAIQNKMMERVRHRVKPEGNDY